MSDPLIKREQPCINPKCSSSDGLMIHQGDNGQLNGYCHSCKTYFKHNQLVESVEGEEPVKERARPTRGHWGRNAGIKEIKEYGIDALGRGISKATAQHFDVRVEVSEENGEQYAHYYPRYNQAGDLVAYKKRALPKKFTVIGNARETKMFGQQQAQPGRKLLLIVEGELDGLSAYELMQKRGKNYNVVATQTAEDLKAIKDNIDFIESHESVILLLDQDKAGKRGAKRIAELLTPGKAQIAEYEDGKDINDLLVAGEVDAFFKAIYNAREFRPDGIIKLSQTWDMMWENESVTSVPYPWEGVNRLLYGMRPREITTITSGSGMGKSAIVREIEWALYHETKDDNIGILALEESAGRTSWGLVSVAARKPWHIMEERKDVSKDEIRKVFDQVNGMDRYICYDHFGSTSTDNLLSQVRYMIRGMDCKWIILDHLSIVVSSMDQNGDERRTIDDIMTRLRMLVEETGAGLILVSHLKRPSGDKGHERGAEVSLGQLRGSHSIAQLSDAVIGLERDQQADDELMQHCTTIRVLKNRYAGLTGKATQVWYDRKTGRLHEVLDLEGWWLGEAEPSPVKW